MLSEAETLYKLMVMYMLKKVNFPLTNSQMSEFFLEKGYTTYFTFQKVLNELTEANLLRMETIGTRTRYELTSEGEETLVFFGNKISDTIREELNTFIRDNKFKLRNEIAIEADYYKSTTMDYIANLKVREGKCTLVELNLSLPSEEHAKVVCERWEKENQGIYEYIVQHLMG